MPRRLPQDLSHGTHAARRRCADSSRCPPSLPQHSKRISRREEPEVGRIEDAALLIGETPPDGQANKGPPVPDVRDRDGQHGFPMRHTSQRLHNGPRISQVLEHISADDQIECTGDARQRILDGHVQDNVIGFSRPRGRFHLDLHADEVGKSQGPQCRTERTRTASNVQGPAASLRDPRQEVDPRVLVVVDGFLARGHRDHDPRPPAGGVRSVHRGSPDLTGAIGGFTTSSYGCRPCVGAGGATSLPERLPSLE